MIYFAYLVFVYLPLKREHLSAPTGHGNVRWDANYKNIQL